MNAFLRKYNFTQEDQKSAEKTSTELYNGWGKFSENKFLEKRKQISLVFVTMNSNNEEITDHFVLR